MNGLDLFTGIGGITLALQDWVKPVAYCEIEPYCQSVLLQRMQEGNMPKAPIWDDIRTLPTNELPSIDIIYAGFPCQNISIAGRQEGLEGERSGLFFEILRLIDETKAPFIFLENVPNIRTKGAERVCKELAQRGYDCRWCNISARDVGARHKRERWFLLGYAKHDGLDASKKSGSLRQTICNFTQRKNETSEPERTDTPRVLSNSKSFGTREMFGGIREGIISDCERENVSNTDNKRNGTPSNENNKWKESNERRNSFDKPSGYSTDIPNAQCKRLYEGCKHKERQTTRCSGELQSDWTAKSNFCRTANDVSEELDSIERTTKETRHRIHRIKALGNSVVPLQVRETFKILLGLK